jgi:uncharacterized membrane protein YbhN (UPF0104 family)
MYWIFFVKIPSQVSYAEVWSTVTSLSIGQNFLLLLAGLLTIVVYGWTSATVLPGLSLKRGVQSAVSGQLTSVILPAPIDLVIRFGMYKSYGFSVNKSTVAVGMAGVARYFTVFAIPLLGLAALIIFGQGTTSYVLWLLGVGSLFIFALWFMRLILSSKKSAKRVGNFTQKIANAALKLIKRSPNNKISKTIVDFGARMHTVAIGNFNPIAISNIAWGLSCYVVFFLALRFCGIDASEMSASYILLITGLMLLFNAFPITPGGIGVTETILLTIIPFSSPAEQAAFTAALFIYRIYTWLLPMPVGVLAYASWRYEIKKGYLKLVK